MSKNKQHDVHSSEISRKLSAATGRPLFGHWRALLALVVTEDLHLRRGAPTGSLTSDSPIGVLILKKIRGKNNFEILDYLG